MKEILNLFRHFKAKGVLISLDDTGKNIKVKGNVAALTEEDKKELRFYKPQLISFLETMTMQRDYEQIPALAQADYSLSSAQRRLWILSKLDENSSTFNIPGVCVFEGDFNPAALSASFDWLLQRHESLRTVFRENEQGEVRQLILSAEEVGFNIAFEDKSKTINSEEITEYQLQEVLSRPFDLASGPLLRVVVYKINDGKWIVACSMHHIIGDGWSMNLLIGELLQFYHTFSKGQQPTLPPLRIQYKDYAEWHQEKLRGEAIKTGQSFWLQQFEGELPVLALAPDQIRPAIKTYSGDMVTFAISPVLTKALRRLVQEEGGTLFMGLQATVAALLYRYTGQEDLITGTIVAGRENTELENQIGLFVNTLALRMRFKGSESFRELFHHVKQTTLQAFEHQSYPFDLLVDNLQLQYDMSRNPLFDLSVVLHNTKIKNTEEDQLLDDLKVSDYNGSIALNSKFDLSFNFTETGEEIDGNIVFNTDIYLKETIIRFAGHMLQLLEAIAVSPDLPLERLDYLTDAEKTELLETFNNTTVPYPGDQSIVSLFQEQVVKNPDKIALIFENKQTSYKELDHKSNQLAAYIKLNTAIGADDKVGILLDRSDKMIIAILGILKSGAAYVPIDPDYPELRKEFIISDTAIKLLVTETTYIFDLEFYQGPVFAIDVQLDDIEIPADLPDIYTIKPNDLAYIMYTSGSTGKPKGVMVEHLNVVRLVKSANFIALTGAEILLSTGAISFDATTFEYWAMLLNGGQLIICQKEVLLDTKTLSAVISQRKVDTMWFTSGWLNQLVDADITLFKGLKTVIAGGDKLSPLHINRLLQEYPQLTIINGYGPTENTTFSLAFRVTEAMLNIPVGKPLQNGSAYITDHLGALVPIGVLGEICVAGDGLSRGYLNQSELTEEKFVINPFRKQTRMYKTGDLGKWLPNGTIIFAGRKDDQVKISGYRIELAEIERVLQNHEAIEAAVVLAIENAHGNKELAAYLVGTGSVLPADIRDYLQKLLPAYMVPVHLLKLDSLPLNSNGKIDKKALPLPGKANTSAADLYVGPRNETEKKVVNIWQKLLNKEKIGITDNFFDLGGDSIRILRMISDLRKEMNIDISVVDVYKNGTIEKILDNTLNHQAATAENVIAEAMTIADINELKQRILLVLSAKERENIADIYPMSDIEKGMIYESMVSEDRGIYHDQLIHRWLYPDFDQERFRRALELLVEKHAILRTGFHLGDFEREVQIVYKKIEVTVSFKNISGKLAEAQKECIQNFLNEEHKRPFEVTAAPLWRMNIFGIGKDDIVFVLQFHHAIMDGWSHASFITELNNLYLKLEDDRHYKPALLKSGYKNFIVQQEMDRKNESMRAFWQQELSDYKRPDLFTDAHELTHYYQIAAPEYLEDLKQLASRLNTNLKTISLAAYLYLLRLLNYDNEIITGLVTNTRPVCEDSEQILGCFLNTIPLRLVIDEQLSFSDFIVRIKNKLIELKENERLSLMEISRLHQVHLDAGNPFFDTFFNYIDFHAYEGLEDKETDFSKTELAGNTRTNIHLDVSVNLTGGRYLASFVLSKKLKSGLTPEKLGKMYFKILDYIIQKPAQPIHELDYLDEEERQQQLVEFNQTITAGANDRTILDLFEEQVRKTPHQAALVFGELTLSYQQLHEESERMSNYLKSCYHIQPNELVAVKLNRSDKMIVAILGILKSGGAYVPIDPEYPQERIDYILSDSKCRVVIDEQELNKFRSSANSYVPEHSSIVQNTDRFAYVIYTSGSTGNPKGCIITHQNLYNYIEWANRYYFGNGARANFGLYTSLSFDLTVTSIFSTLTQGGTLHVYGQQEELTAILSHTFSNSGTINSIKLTPSHLNVLSALELSSSAVTCAIVGGEQVTQEQISVLKQINPAIKIYNEYGPTEATVGCIVTELQENVPVLIGKPISNTQVYVMNSTGNLSPAGVVGELGISGEGLAKGYLNQVELTANRFVKNPFVKETRLYKTGDLVRWHPDGNMEYIGRKDEQVKIRGYRIEPGEIEAALQSHPDVYAAAVIVHTNQYAEKVLVAYFTAERSFQFADIRTYLAKLLPAYMLPSYGVQLDELPLSPNGKLDRRQLPALDTDELETGVDYIAPRNETEEKLLLIWKSVLQKEKISVKDNFFAIGGHSISVTRLASQLHKEFEMKIPIRQLFVAATLEQQAQFLQKMSKTSFSSILPVPVQPDYPSSVAQRRLWILSQFEEGSAAYNIPGLYIFEGEIDQISLDYAFDKVISRHESLRTVFKEDDSGDIRQVIKLPQETHFKIHCREVESTVQLENLIENEIALPFDLSTGPLIRVSIFAVAPGQWVFCYVMHHIISDGWSGNILIHELLKFYKAHLNGVTDSLPPLRIQYKDYADWQQQQLNSSDFDRHKHYWQHILKEELPVLQFPDQTRPVVRTYNGAAVHKLFQLELLQQLKLMSGERDGTLFMGLLTVVNTFLFCYTGQRDLIVGTPVAGREHIDLENQIGFYLNTLPLRTQFKETYNFNALFAVVREVALGAYEHQEYPFDEIVNALKLHRDTSRNFLFDVWVVLHNANVNKIGEEDTPAGLKISPYTASETRFSKFDLLFSFVESEEGLYVSLEYNTDIFSEKEAERQLLQFEKILKELTQNPGLPLSAIRTNFLALEKENQEQHLKNMRKKNLGKLINKSY